MGGVSRSPALTLTRNRPPFTVSQPVPDASAPNGRKIAALNKGFGLSGLKMAPAVVKATAIVRSHIKELTTVAAPAGLASWPNSDLEFGVWKGTYEDLVAAGFIGDVRYPSIVK